MRMDERQQLHLRPEKPPPMAAPTIRVFTAGNSGSGKTTRVWRQYLTRFPRVLIIDQTGEWTDPQKEWCPHIDADAVDLKTCIAAIQDHAKAGKWVIACSLDPDELPALVDWLIPVPQLERSPIRTLGGVALYLDEVDLLMPPGVPGAHARTVFRRSRHVGLSIFA